MYRYLILDPVRTVEDFSPRDHLLQLFANKKAEQQLHHLLFDSNAWKRFELGQLSEYDYLALTAHRAQELHLTYELQAMQDSWQDIFQQNNHTVHALNRLCQKGLQLFYYGALPRPALELLQSRSYWPLFEGGLATCECGLSAYDPTMLKQLLALYQLNPAECIFTAAKPSQCAVAADLGLFTLPFRNATRLERSLARPLAGGQPKKSETPFFFGFGAAKKKAAPPQNRQSSSDQ